MQQFRSRYYSYILQPVEPFLMVKLMSKLDSDLWASRLLRDQVYNYDVANLSKILNFGRQMLTF